MKRVWLIVVPMVLLSLAGAIINAYLTAKHVGKGGTPSWFQSICAPEDNPEYNCDVVLDTKWAVVSPKTLWFVEPDPETGKQDGIPVAMLGWWYFTFLMVWYLFIGKTRGRHRWWHIVPTMTVLAGVATSLFFIYILFFKMETRCTWCLVSHCINFALLAGTFSLWFVGRKRAAAGVDGAETASDDDSFCRTCGRSEAAALPPAHPQFALVLATVALAMSMAMVEFMSAQWLRTLNERAAYKRALDEVHSDVMAQIASFESQEHHKIPFRKDDPKRPDDNEIMMKLTVFSDFQCPGCSKFARRLEKQIADEEDPWLRVVWKHYPLCKDCNPGIARNMHPQACEAAKAAEAARLQGGNEAFWKAHDMLFEAQRAMPRFNYRKFAEHLGLDADKFIEDMNSEAVSKRIAEDIALGKELGVTGTPTIFLGGRKVKQYMLTNPPFVEYYKKRVLAARAKRDAKLKARKARSNQTQADALNRAHQDDEDHEIPERTTPDNQDQPNAQ